MSMNREEVHRKPDHFVDPSRLEAVGDAIFAFALTLLALDLRLPEIEPDQLAQGILALLPKLLVFLFSFLIVANVWYLHQRSMIHIVRTDGLFAWLYLLFLLFVVLMPASADILGRFPAQPLALAAFGVNAGLLVTAMWIMWQRAITGKLLDETLEPYQIKRTSRLTLFTAAYYFVTIPLGFISVYLVYLFWVATPIFFYAYLAPRWSRNRTE
jgi:uncharacterized membrane protein